MADTTTTDTPAPVDMGKKFPELHGIREKLHAERQEILKASAPHRQQREELLKKIQPLEDQLRKVDAEIKKAERPRLGEIDTQLGRLAVAMGGRSMQQPEAK